MRPQRFADDQLQHYGPQVHGTVSQLAGAGKTAEAANYLLRFIDIADGIISGPERGPRRGLADFFTTAAANSSDDARFLWLMTADLLRDLPALRACFFADLEALIEHPATPPQIVFGALHFGSPPDRERVIGALYDRIDRHGDLAVRHACYQRLGFGMGSLYAQYPRLRRRRWESFRRLVEAFAVPAGPIERLRPRSSGAGRRVAIMTARLAGDRHSPSRVVASYAEALRHHAGFDVAVFETRDVELSHDEALLFLPRKWPPATGDILDRLAAAGVGHHVFMPERSRLAQIQDILASVQAFGPDVVLSIGATDSVAKALLGRALPVIDLYLGGQYLLYQDADAMLAPLALPLVQAECTASALPERLAAYQHHHTAVDLPPRPEPLLRAELGLRPDGLVLATVGIMLDGSMTQPFLDRMATLLRAHPSLQWIVIGPREPPGMAALLADAALQGRIIRLSFEHRLPAALAATDIYVNPIAATGGGFAAVDALAAGCPVVAMAGGDVALLIGEGYAETDEAGYWARLEGLIAAPGRIAPLAAEMLEDLGRRHGLRQAATHVALVIDRLLAGRAA
jgi:glycosyltransferase involved in cell wall biosynthesis